MVSRADGSEHGVKDRSVARSAIDPWSDDQTTVIYEPMHAYFAHKAAPAVQHDQTEDAVAAAARTRSTSWVRAAVAAVGLFSALLFGRVLLEASTGTRVHVRVRVLNDKQAVTPVTTVTPEKPNRQP
ncbi:MAG: hypothetical protein RL701_359 [Pseudomonadota bacterium]|jgi:hypothetical protein